MNSLTRVCDVIKGLSDNRNDNFFTAYKKIFNTDSEIEILKSMVLLDKEIKNSIDVFAKLSGDDSQELLEIKNSLSYLTSTVHLYTSVSNKLAELLKAKDLLFVISKFYSEQDVSEQLSSVQADLDSFLEKIIHLDISETEKMLYTKITLQLKESIYFYSITGIEGINIPLKAFGCITKDTPEGKSLYEKIASIAEIGGSIVTIGDTLTRFLS